MGPRRDRRFNRNSFKLGLFGPNSSGGMAATRAPERWSASWENNLKLARLADEAGLEFLLPIARWRGYGGETDFEGETLEATTWAAGVLAETRRLTAFATVHAPLTHPLVAAKQLVTVDLLSQGRVGLNLVCGWNQDEFDMFGLSQREHDERYQYGREWLDVLKRVWSETAEFDFQGRYFQLRGVTGKPRPYRGTRPLIMNAGSSTAGRHFGACECDLLFTKLVDLGEAASEVEEIRRQAQASNPELEIFTAAHLVVRPSEREAQEFYHYYAREMADEEAIDRLIRLHGLYSRYRDGALSRESYRRYRTWFAGGHGTYPLVGNPDQVAEGLRCIQAAGIGGVAFSLVHYLNELPYFVQEVVPRLEKAGLRMAD